MAYNRFSHVSPFKNVEAHIGKVLRVVAWLAHLSWPPVIDSDVAIVHDLYY